MFIKLSRCAALTKMLQDGSRMKRNPSKAAKLAAASASQRTCETQLKAPAAPHHAGKTDMEINKTAVFTEPAANLVLMDPC